MHGSCTKAWIISYFSSNSSSFQSHCICHCQKISEAFIAQTKQVLEIGIISFVYNHCRYFLRIKTACIFVCFTAHDKKLNFIFLHFISKKTIVLQWSSYKLVRKGWPKKANINETTNLFLKRGLH